MATFSTNFSSSENPLSTGWTNFTGANRSISGTATTTGAFAGNLTGYSGEVWTENHYAEVKVTSLATADNAATRGIGPAVRCQTVDGSGNYGYALQIHTNESRLVLQRAGDASVIIGATDTTDWVNGDIARLSIVDDLLTVYRNGAVLYTRTDSTLSGGVPGFAIMRSTTSIDDFSASDIFGRKYTSIQSTGTKSFIQITKSQTVGKFIVVTKP